MLEQRSGPLLLAVLEGDHQQRVPTVVDSVESLSGDGLDSVETLEVLHELVRSISRARDQLVQLHVLRHRGSAVAVWPPTCLPLGSPIAASTGGISGPYAEFFAA